MPPRHEPPADIARELTLDPDDWARLRRLAHRMVDDMMGHLANLRTQPAWRAMPDAVRDSFSEPLPHAPGGEEQTYQEFLERVLPYPNGNLHPRFWGWVQGNGSAFAMMADMLASGLNPHLAGFNQAPALVEHQVIAWLAEMMRMPTGTSGVLVSGGTLANLLGIAVARHNKAGFNVRELGMQGNAGPPMTLYGSSETHGWAQKAAELLGFGNRHLRRVPTDAHHRIDLDALAQMIAQDRRDGFRPVCVIGTAGTVNTGATDDLRALARLCHAEDIWFHVDGAFGAFAQLSDRLRPLVDGMEEADSIGIDLHKWMYLPFDVGCVLVRDAKRHRDTFAMTPSYLAEMERGVIAGGLPFADRGVDLTRSFRALKVWMSLKAHGVDLYTRLIEQNVDQAAYLGSLIDARPELELLAPVSLNIVCFRYRRPGDTEQQSNALNQELLLRLQERGIAVPSSTILDGRFALRVAIVNHRSRRSDFKTLVDAAVHLGDGIASTRLPRDGMTAG